MTALQSYSRRQVAKPPSPLLPAIEAVSESEASKCAPAPAASESGVCPVWVFCINELLSKAGLALGQVVEKIEESFLIVICLSKWLPPWLWSRSARFTGPRSKQNDEQKAVRVG